MKKIFSKRYRLMVILGATLLWGCSRLPSSTAEGDRATDATIHESDTFADVCPPEVAELPPETLKQKVGDSTYIFNRFDYAPRKIVARENTVRFSAREYDFVYCRAEDSWTVQPGTLGDEWLLKMGDRFDTEPAFSSLEANGKTYQYRVVRDAVPGGVLQYSAVTLELLLPGQETPQRQRLYTLTDLERVSGSRNEGAPVARLGIPYITQATAYKNRLWWTIAFEQGEGNSGIATIVSYDPATGEVDLIQPPELWSEQILDLTFTGDPEQPTLWLGLKSGSEGNSNIPASGLVAYQPNPGDMTTGRLREYTPYNSPLIGAIPTQLAVDGDSLWVGTRNGTCQVPWQTPDTPKSWNCWQFTTEATLSSAGAANGASLPVYPSLLSETPEKTLPPNQPVEVLWWMISKLNPQQGRYEVRLKESFEASIEQGASPVLDPQQIEIAGRVPVLWPGYWWHWQGDRFVRPLDGHLNDQIVGDLGIGPREQTGPRNNWYAMRGDLNLAALSKTSTRVEYYSGWVDDERLKPYPKVIKRDLPLEVLENPLAKIKP